MPRPDECFDEVKAAFGGTLSDDDLLEVLEEFQKVARDATLNRPHLGLQEELFGHAQRLARDAREAVLIKRRNRSLDNRREAALREFVDRPDYAADPYQAVLARTVGTIGFRQGGKASVHRQGAALAQFWVGSLDNALTRAELTRVVAKGALDREIAVELWQLGRKDGQPGISGSKAAQEAARIIHRLQENVVARKNRAGAFIRRMPGYIVKQSHDPARMKRAGFDRWYNDTWHRIDEMRTFNRRLADDERRALYETMHKRLSVGEHVEEQLPEEPMAAFLPAGSLAKRLSASRELHFKSGQDWHAYHQSYGQGTILENVARTVLSDARSIAVMETFGTRPKEMFEGFVKLADAKALEVGVGTSRQHGVLSPGVLWATVSGEMNQPGNDRFARIATVARATQVLSKLGGAVISAIADAPVISNELSRHGVPFLTRAASPIVNIVRNIADNGERRRVANMLGAYNEGLLAETFGRFELGDGAPGVASFLMRKLFKWTGLEGWTNAHKTGVAHAISAELGDRLGGAWAELPPDYRRMLEAYDITEADWPALGGAVLEQNGRRYAVPHALRLEGSGDVTTAEGRRAARRARDQLAGKLMSFLSDRLESAVITPGARTKAIMLQGSRPGTAAGEGLRAIAQFKGFPVEILVRTWGERLAHGEYLQLAATVLGMTVMGHVNNQIRDLLAGLEPVDYTELGPTEALQVFARAFTAGGGAGIMGDFILGEHNRYGRGLVATMAGPIPGQLDSVAEIWAAIIRGEDAGAKAFRTLYTNVPFVNLWYLRSAFNYLLLYPMQEAVNPGYLRRMERRKQQETGQRYIAPPSETAPKLRDFVPPSL